MNRRLCSLLLFPLIACTDGGDGIAGRDATPADTIADVRDLGFPSRDADAGQPPPRRDADAEVEEVGPDAGDGGDAAAVGPDAGDAGDAGPDASDGGPVDTGPTRAVGESCVQSSDCLPPGRCVDVTGVAGTPRPIDAVCLAPNPTFTSTGCPAGLKPILSNTDCNASCMSDTDCRPTGWHCDDFARNVCHPIVRCSTPDDCFHLTIGGDEFVCDTTEGNGRCERTAL